MAVALATGALVCGTARGHAQLPATAPTATTQVAPLAASPVVANGPSHRPEVTCTGGQLTVHADNSSLNGILRAISRCSGMRITGGVAEQRVFGSYGPAAPATVLATLIDGTGSNMLLKETVADQPAELILTPRTGGATPPPPSSYSDTAQDETQGIPTAGTVAPSAQTPFGMRGGMAPMRRPGLPPMQDAGSTSSPQQQQPGSAPMGPPSIPQPLNNVNGSSENTSPTASTYPTTNSVPVVSVATPSTTPSSEGIVDAPNPPAAGSDTAAAMNGANPNAPSGSAATTGQTQAGGTTTGAASTDLTPEQIFQQLQQRQQQNQPAQQQQQENTTTTPQ